ncbi:MAG TPA: type II 3-dehydroquinate dehydratase [Roseomonas sp.]|jgi:3-dehydroquinate dehydratase-2
MVLNGPNLNLLGLREPELYGTGTLDDVQRLCEAEAGELGMEIDFRQSNHEGVILDWMHEAQTSAAGVVINAAALARTSLSLHDAAKAITVPVVEIHITNIYKRDAFRPSSYLSKAAVGVICGFGHYVYALGLRAIHHHLAHMPVKA